MCEYGTVSRSAKYIAKRKSEEESNAYSISSLV